MSSSTYELINWDVIFQQIDKDNDGLILRSDLKHFLLKYPLSHVRLPEDLVDSILYQVDFNNDGFIDKREFLHLVNIQTDYKTQKAVRRSLVKAALSVAPRSQVSHGDRHYIEQYMCCPPPLIIPLLCVLQIGFFIYYSVESSNSVRPYVPVDLNSVLVFNPHKRSEVWRFVTYMLVHAGYVHLLSNVIVCLMLGLPLEMVHRSWRILALFMSGVIFGSIVASIFSPHAYLVGASGGCYALIAAHLANIVMNWSEMPFNWARLLLFIVLIGSDIGTFIYYTVNNTEKNISYSAHIAGFVAGLLIGMISLRNLIEHRWENILKWIGFVIFIALLCLAIILHIVSPAFIGFYPDSTTVNSAGFITTA